MHCDCLNRIFRGDYFILVTLQPSGRRIRKNSESPQFNSELTEFLRIQLHFRGVAIWLN